MRFKTATEGYSLHQIKLTEVVHSTFTVSFLRSL